MSTPSVAAAPSPRRQRGLDVEALRREFPILEQAVAGRRLVYLDSAATSQKPRAVIDAVADYYERDNANVHRSIHTLAARATEAYESARSTVARFIGGDPDEVVFVRGCTEAVNLVAASWGRANLRAGDEILLSVMEHHSNLVPWQMLASATGARLRFLDVTEEGTLGLDGPNGLDALLTPRTRLVALTHLSNGLGTVNPVQEIARRARSIGARILVDGAQSVARMPIDVRALGADFFAFSSHKMYGPTGIGVLWARRELLEEMPPFQTGGEMIERVELERSTWNRVPHKFEAGTPHVAGAVGLAAAIAFLETLTMGAVREHDAALAAYALDRLAAVPGVRLFGPPAGDTHLGAVSFTLADVHPHDLATILDTEGVAIRAGHHCNQPLMRRLGVTSTARASFAVHNGEDDVDALVSALATARRLFGVA